MRQLPKYIITAMIALPLSAFGQKASVQGNINIPALLRLDVNYANNQLGFDDFDEFVKGKEYRNCISLSVVSSCPWIITVRSADQNLNRSSKTASKVSNDIISLKPSGSNSYQPVSNIPAPILLSDNDDVRNQYNLDLKLGNAWNVEGGQYDMNLIFSISAQ